MKTSMQSKLDQLTTRLAELNDLLSREDITANLDQYRKLTREHAELGPVVEHYALWRQASNDALTAQELLADTSMRDFAEDEIRAARERMDKLGATSSSKSAQVPAATNRRCLRAICCGCICASPSATAGRLK
jgi:peptide chain release factor 1